MSRKLTFDEFIAMSNEGVSEGIYKHHILHDLDNFWAHIDGKI